jgi:hypothetical protein
VAFSEQEKVKIRAALGYGNVSSVQTFSLGVPAAVETQFLIEGAMNRVLPEAELEVRRLVGVLEGIEAQMTGDLELLAVERIGEITINEKEQQKLRSVYQHWQRQLGNLLMVPPNPYDQRFMNAGGVNVGVSH